MEGYLEILQYFEQPFVVKKRGLEWVSKYFVLDDEVLAFANSEQDFDNGNIKGEIHLNTIQIKNKNTKIGPEDNNVLILNNGLTYIKVKGISLDEINEWRTAIIEA